MDNNDIRSLTTILPIRLNAGGSAFVNDQSNQWEPDDAYANTGKKWRTTETIENTPYQNLYQTERRDKLGGKQLKYIFQVPNAYYRVKLHLSENYANAKGERIFNVWIQGLVEFWNVDIFSQAGGKFKPLVLEEGVPVKDGTLVITFQHVTENPNVNGIEILPLDDLPPPEACIKCTVDLSQPALIGKILNHGDYVPDEWAPFGMVLSASGGIRSAPRLFNTSNVAGSQDADLGTPNEQCIPCGPGIGEGGEPDMPGKAMHSSFKIRMAM